MTERPVREPLAGNCGVRRAPGGEASRKPRPVKRPVTGRQPGQRTVGYGSRHMGRLVSCGRPPSWTCGLPDGSIPTRERTRGERKSIDHRLTRPLVRSRHHRPHQPGAYPHPLTPARPCVSRHSDRLTRLADRGTPGWLRALDTRPGAPQKDDGYLGVRGGLHPAGQISRARAELA